MVRVRLTYIISVVFLSLSIGGAVIFPGVSLAGDGGFCDKQFKTIENSGKYPTPENKIDKWKSFKDKCGKSGLYESRLGKLYSDAGINDEAKKIILEGISYNTKHDKELKFGLADVYVAQGKYDEAEKVAWQLKESYGDWFGGYFMLGNVYVIKRRFREAINVLNKANTLTDTMDGQLMLVLAYHQTDNHQKTIESMQSSLEFGDHPLTVRSAVISTAYSLMALGRLQGAKDILSVHQKKTVGSENDQNFIKAVMYLKQRISEAKKQ